MARWIKPTTRVRTVKLDGKPHAHRCRRCAVRYEDSCSAAALDAKCSRCRSGNPHPQALWMTDRLPQPCCRTASRIASHEERQTYCLAGTSTWWICTTCKRTHPNNPTKETP